MEMNREIINLLRKHYVAFSESQWAKFAAAKDLSPDETRAWFDRIWGREHGGYFSRQDFAEFHPPELLPTVVAPGHLHFPEVASNDPAFQQTYVDVGNRLLLENDTVHLTLDFRNNGGGKPQTMIAALLPLFNLSSRTVLAYITRADGGRKREVLKRENCIMSVSNGRATDCGSRRAVSHVQKLTLLINKYTVSAAEKSVLALLSLRDVLEIDVVGGRTAGATTCIQYFRLSNGDGIEVPVGYMTSIDGRVWRRGVTPGA
jgi:hypothetical protein